MVMPNKAVSANYLMCFLTVEMVSIVVFKANGAKTIQATAQRQNAKPIGGICPLIPLAITIFPDQSKVASKANITPFIVLFITRGYLFWHTARA